MDRSLVRHGPQRPQDPVRDAYARAADRGRSRTLAGDFRSALKQYRLARVYAERTGDRALCDAADLNLAMVRLQLGQAQRGEDGLREILLRSSDPRLRFTAAYHLASSLRKQARYAKARSYAERALDGARRMDDDELVAAAEMLFGNILLAESYPDRALEHYRVALAIRERDPRANRYSLAILLENLGYCRMLGGDVRGGIADVERALAIAEEVGDRRCVAECLQDLSYGHLSCDELATAAERGERALALAQTQRYGDIAENCHYLLGEIRGRLGEDAARDEHFSRLQELHPELPFLKDFLCAVDVSRIITLKR